MELEAAQQILSYAKDGLSIILIGQTPTKDGTFKTDSNSQVAAVFEELKKLSNVYSIDGEEELPSALKQAGVTPYVDTVLKAEAPEESSSSIPEPDSSDSSGEGNSSSQGQPNTGESAPIALAMLTLAAAGTVILLKRRHA